MIPSPIHAAWCLIKSTMSGSWFIIRGTKQLKRIRNDWSMGACSSNEKWDGWMMKMIQMMEFEHMKGRETFSKPGWPQIKVGMDPIFGKCCHGNLDTARSHRFLSPHDHDNPHPRIDREYHRKHDSHDGRTISSWSPCSRPQPGDGGKHLVDPLHPGKIWKNNDEYLFGHNTRARQGMNNSGETWNLHHVDDHNHNHNHNHDDDYD